MGLNMYLTAKVSLGDYDFCPKEKEICENLYSMFGVEDNVERNNSVVVSFPMAYWRKANAIHAWFVENIQDGEDDCQECWVPREVLEHLLSICKEVFKDHEKAPTLLPVQAGFFFGSTEYGDWYFNQIEYTISTLERVFSFLETDNGKTFEIYYRASW